MYVGGIGLICSPNAKQNPSVGLPIRLQAYTLYCTGLFFVHLLAAQTEHPANNLTGPKIRIVKARTFASVPHISIIFLICWWVSTLKSFQLCLPRILAVCVQFALGDAWNSLVEWLQRRWQRISVHKTTPLTQKANGFGTILNRQERPQQSLNNNSNCNVRRIKTVDNKIQTTQQHTVHRNCVCARCKTSTLCHFDCGKTKVTRWHLAIINRYRLRVLTLYHVCLVVVVRCRRSLYSSLFPTIILHVFLLALSMFFHITLLSG